ncbi:MAG: hypothetical protein M3459_13640 [Actinomycetota bacterium]|nr:hypothetical protein [Actinomycetota bacterium]
MAEGVDAAVHHVQPAGGDAAVDRVWAQADRKQLRAVDHRVLALSERHDPVLDGLTATIAANSTRGAHGPSLTGKNARVTRGL